MRTMKRMRTRTINNICLYFQVPPKEKSGANGQFLPKPLLFHLRHPNSKTNEPKFWQILSQKNSFAKTSSALKPHALPEYLEGRNPKEKPSFLFQNKFSPRHIRNARSVFSFGVAGVLASAWGFGSFVQFPLEKGSRKVYNYSTDDLYPKKWTRVHVFFC